MKIGQETCSDRHIKVRSDNDLMGVVIRGWWGICDGQYQIRGGGVSSGPDMIGQLRHHIACAAKLWGTVDILHWQGEAEANEGVGVQQVGRDDKGNPWEVI